MTPSVMTDAARDLDESDQSMTTQKVSGDPSLELLAAWVNREDHQAFASLVHRYGALVRTSCRRVLGTVASNQAGHLVADSQPFKVGKLIRAGRTSEFETTIQVEARHCPYFCVGLAVTNLQGDNPHLNPLLGTIPATESVGMRQAGNHTLGVTIAPPQNGTLEVVWRTDGVERLRLQVPEAFLGAVSLVVCSGRVEVIAESGNNQAGAQVIK